MYLIAGLGNPEKKYEATRHNIGFETVDLMAHKLGVGITTLKHKALFGECFIGSEKVIIAKPQTYMNLSGESIRDIASFYKIPTENIIIICDDINLETGRIRIRPKGSDGGHNGLKSIIYQLADDGFTRIRMGVGAPKGEHYNLADYVLGKFSKEEIEVLTVTANRVVDAVECIIKNDVATAMNRFNGAAK